MGSFVTWKFGEFDVTVLSDGTSAFPSQFLMIGASDHERLSACERLNYDPEAVPSSINVVHVRSPRWSAMFDTGAGASLPGCGTLLDSMSNAGIDRESIDYVIHTHAHLDHIGWNTTEPGVATFPNATYLVGETEFGFWSSEETLEKLERSELWNLPAFEPGMAAAARVQVLSLGDRVRTFADDGQPIDGVQAIPAFGHTPGHLAFAVDLGDETFLITGDLALNPVHIERSNWFPGVDLNPEQAMQSRARLFSDAAERGDLVTGYHLPFPGVGHLSTANGGWEWTEFLPEDRS